MTSFFAIDVETANSAMHTICQIGLVEFRDGLEVSARSWLINPRTHFDDYNVRVHGITPERVMGSPHFGEVVDQLADLTHGAVLVCHTHFDRAALAQACSFIQREALACRWLDSALVVRRTWEEFAAKGYGLANVAQYLGISFQHHDALEDARTAGLILLKAIEQSGHPLEEWCSMVGQKGLVDSRMPFQRGSKERATSPGPLARLRRDAVGMASALGTALDSTRQVVKVRSTADATAKALVGWTAELRMPAAVSDVRRRLTPSAEAIATVRRIATDKRTISAAMFIVTTGIGFASRNNKFARSAQLALAVLELGSDAFAGRRPNALRSGKGRVAPNKLRVGLARYLDMGRWRRTGQRGPLASFKYCDKNGVVTERMVRNWKTTGRLLSGYCVHRRAIRTFRTDRVIEWAELEQ